MEQNPKVQVNLTELNTMIVGFCELFSSQRTILCTSIYVFYDPDEGHHNNCRIKFGAAANAFYVTVAGVVKGRSSHWRRRRRLNKRTLAFLETFDF